MSEKENPESKEQQATSDAATVPHDHDHDDDHDHDHEHGHGHDHDHEEKEFEFVEAPVFTIDYKGNCAYEVKVSIASSNEKKQAEEVLEHLQAEADVPGFRRGRAPRKLLERKFGKAVRDEVSEKLIAAAFQKLVKDNDLKPLSMPKVEGIEEAKERAEDAPLDLLFKFEVMPRVNLSDFRGVEVERPVVTIDDNDIDEAAMNVRRRFALYETVADAAAADGDQVIIGFHGTINGEEFSGNKAENYPYILGTKRFFPEFEAVLQGQKAGAEVECDVTFPADYRAADLAGKIAHFKITIHEIKRRQLPELTDEFAKQAGYESIADMRTKIADDLRAGSSAQSNSIAEQAALEKIVEASTFELPESLLESVTHDTYEQERRRLREMRVPASDVEARDAELRQSAREQAEREMKEFVVLREIARLEKLEVQDADFEREAEAISRRTGAELKTVAGVLKGDEYRDDYVDRILRRKALELIMQNAKVTDKEIPREEDEKGDDTAKS